jgi:hypothetical protein
VSYFSEVCKDTNNSILPINKVENITNKIGLKFFCFLITIMFANTAVAIRNPKDSVMAVSLVGLSYGYQIPQNDLKNRFYNNSTVGLNFYRKTKRNLIFGVDWSLMFAQKVKEQDMFLGVLNSDGFLIDENGQNSSVRLYQRGHFFNAKLGKIIPIGKPNKNSGLLILLNGGWLQHKIKIEDLGNLTPALKDDYKKGYDRLRGGLSIGFFAGYIFMSDNRYFNFFGGIEGYYANTQSLRSWDFQKMRFDDAKYSDALLGLKFGIILPLYKRATNAFYIY